MKKLITLLPLLLITAAIWAQSPANMSYQATVRNSDGELVSNQQVGMKISILQGSSTGTAVYSETHNINTNDNGLVTCEIGDGSNVSGSLSGIDWENGPYFLKIETDPEGGTNYTIAGTSQLLSVPYARHAKYAKNLTGGISESDPVFNSSIAATISGSDTANWNNKVNRNPDLIGESWDITWYWSKNKGGTTITYNADHTTTNANTNSYTWYLFDKVYFHFIEEGTTYIGYLYDENTIYGTMISAVTNGAGHFEIFKNTKGEPQNSGNVDENGVLTNLKR
jgi:hypothetical protein